MHIDIWSDYVCPFCYIGKRRLELALEQFTYKQQVTISYKSYELDPNAPAESTMGIHAMLAAKYGMTIDEAKKANANVAAQAESVGLTFRFDNMVPTNTFDAHRLAKFAKKHEKENAMIEILFKAYFTDSERLANHNTLAKLAGQAGLNCKEVFEILEDPKAFADEVRSDEEMAKQMGIRGVPFFVFNQKYAVSGAQPMETFVSVLQKVWASEKQTPVLRHLTDDGAGCVDDSCEIPVNKNG